MRFEASISDIAFTKVKLPFGWLGNMSPHPVFHLGKNWLTTKALFQALRFSGAREDLRLAIWREKSPMAAKMVAKRLRNENASDPSAFAHEPLGPGDLEAMRLMLRLKVAQHPHLRRELLDTGDRRIIEDIGARKGPRHEFWGARSQAGEWIGRNHLGELWMELRSALAADPALVEGHTRAAQAAKV